VGNPGIDPVVPLARRKRTCQVCVPIFSIQAMSTSLGVFVMWWEAPLWDTAPHPRIAEFGSSVGNRRLITAWWW
jgi:hypothetical protein